MKKTLIAVLGMAMIAPMAWAQTNVLSQNAVGYVKLSIPASGLALARHDFENIDGTPVNLTDLVGLDLPDNTKLFKWDRINTQYVSSTLTTDFFGNKSWSDTSIEVVRGDAFWVINGDTANPIEVYLLGEVPGANNGGDTTTVTPSEGFTGFPYPAATLWEDTQLSADMPVPSAIFTWDGVGYTKVSKTEDFFGNISWSANPVINPGEGFWVDAGGTGPSVTETKPYAWP